MRTSVQEQVERSQSSPELRVHNREIFGNQPPLHKRLNAPSSLRHAALPQCGAEEREPAQAAALSARTQAAEHVWDGLRENEFPNRVYADMASVRVQVEAGLSRLAADRKALRSLTAWPWINRLNLSAQ